MSLVDVIIGVRNEEKHLGRCLTSLQNQSITDIQIFVIDGQSEDRTHDIVLERMKDDPRIKLFDNPKIMISSARNIGIEASKAEYVAYLDGHCYVKPDWLETLLKTYQKYERKCKIGGVGSTYASPDDDTSYGKIVASALRTPFGGLGTAYRKDEKVEVVDTVAFALYKRSTLNEEGILYDESMTHCEDTDFNYRLVVNGYTLLKHPNALVYQYRRPNTGQFFKQMVKYGEGRCLFAKKHPHTLQIYHLFPLMAIFYLIIVILSLLLFLLLAYLTSIVIIILFIPVALYIVLCLFYTFKIYLQTSDPSAIYSVLIYPSVHLGYGWGFLKAIITK
jgi:succinoglycan biosynthesis protein ExoA